jgi:hypothetical protein
MMDFVTRAIERLRFAGLRLDPGLSDTEVSRVQQQFGFKFGPEHRELIQTVLPIGVDAGPDWRSGSFDDLRRRLDWPVDGLIFDVHNNSFWPSSWGQRPDSRHDRESCARERLAKVPRLIPLYSHRYLTADPAYRPKLCLLGVSVRRHLLRRQPP